MASRLEERRPQRKKAAFFCCIAGAVAFLIFLPNTALAVPPQPSMSSVDQATREADRSVRQQVEKRFQETTPRKPPKVKDIKLEEKREGPAFMVKKITLEGVESFKPEDFSTIVSNYENKELTISDLKILSGEIEREYLKRDIIAACFLPPQDIKDGAVKLRVVEAKMGNLEVKKMRYFSEDRIRYYWSIAPGEVLRYGEISRSLQIINKNPDRMAKAALHAGDKPETTDVVVEAATNFPIHMTAMLDREGIISTGKLRRGFGVVDNNLLGLDDSLVLGYIGGTSFNGAYGYHRVPITNFGTTIMYGYNWTTSSPKKNYEVYDMHSTVESYSVFVYQDLFEGSDYRGEISAGLEKNNKRVISGIYNDLNIDKLTVSTVAATLVKRVQGRNISFRTAFSQGLNFLGSRPKNPLSSRLAGSTFSRFQVSANFRQALVKNYQANLKFTGQAASEKLTPQYEMYMGGIDSVRGYPSGDYLADSGIYANLELLVPMPFLPEWVKVPYGERPLKDDITGVLFFDYGIGSKRGKIQGEQSVDRMASIGVGVRVKLMNQALLRLEWGIPLDPMVNRPITEGGGNRPRLHFSIDFQDDLPEEVERFSKVFKDEYLNKAAWDIVDKEMKNENSLLHKNIYKNLTLAKKAQKRGDMASAKKYYSKIASIGSSAYRQVEIYLKENYKNMDTLRAANEEAAAYYKEGDYKKSKEMSQKIIEDAKIKPLSIYIR